VVKKIVLILILALSVQLALAAKWGGTDDQAKSVVSNLTDGNYTPWMKPVWKPPSGEIESLLFSIQTGIGALIIGYYIGYWKAKKEGKN